MYKVQTFGAFGGSFTMLQDHINGWLERHSDIHLIDIKYTTCAVGNALAQQAMIIYKEAKDDDN